MIGLSPQELLAFSRGSLVLPVRGEVTGFSIDSRSMRQGNVFVALKGEKSDGHEFLRDADRKGASCLVIDSEMDLRGIDAGVIRVGNSLKALQEIARKKRLKNDYKVIAITGSTGKTTTKEILIEILKYDFKLCASEGNYNNEIGLPLSIVNANDCDMLVLEMAMRGKGQIRELCEIALPNCGIITNIGKSHLQELGTEENIALAKGELAEHLGTGSVLALNADDSWTPLLSSMTASAVSTFGFSGSANVRITDFTEDNKGSSFYLSFDGEKTQIATDAPGVHIAQNIAAACVIAFSLGVKPDIISKAVSSLSAALSRQAMVRNGSVTIINDTYNANPDSMVKALNLFRLYKHRRKVAILGSMAELGGQSEALHFEVGKSVVDNGVDVLVTIGEQALSIFKGASSEGFKSLHKHYESPEIACRRLNGVINSNDIVLVKGSRFLKMERIVSKLMGENAGF